MNISLRQFLATGRLGDLRLGDTVERVHALLGGPEDVGGVSSKHPWPSTYVYGTVKVFLSRGPSPLCRGITWKMGRGPFHLRDADTVEDWGLTPGMGRDAVEAYLEGAGLAFLPQGETMLLLRSGVVIKFDEDGVLDSIGAWEGAMINAARWMSR